MDVAKKPHFSPKIDFFFCERESTSGPKHIWPPQAPSFQRIPLLPPSSLLLPLPLLPGSRAASGRLTAVSASVPGRRQARSRQGGSIEPSNAVANDRHRWARLPTSRSSRISKWLLSQGDSCPSRLDSGAG